MKLDHKTIETISKQITYRIDNPNMEDPPFFNAHSYDTFEQLLREYLESLDLILEGAHDRSEEYLLTLEEKK